MDKSQIKAFFKQAKSDAKESAVGFEEPPQGTFNAKLKKAEYYVTKAGVSNIKTNWILDVDGTEKSFFQYSNIEHPVGLKILIQEWDKLGVDTDAVEDFESIAEVANAFADYEFSVSLKVGKNKGGFPTWNIQEVLGYKSDDSAKEVEAVEAEAVEAVETGVALVVEAGDSVTFTVDGESQEGVVILVEDDEAIVKVGKKKMPIALSSITSVD